MSNVLQNNKDAPGIIAKVLAGTLADKLQFAKSIDKEDDAVFSKDAYNGQPGDTIQIKKPARFLVGNSLDITSTMQDVVEEKVPLVLDKVCTTAITMDSLEIAYKKSLKKWKDDIVDPIMDAFAADIDTWALNKACLATNNLVGTAGTTPAAVLTYQQAEQRIFENLAPRDSNKFCILNPTANTATSDARKGLFHPNEELEKIYKEGAVGQGQGLKYLRSNLLPTFTNGNDVTGAAVDDTVANGASTIHIDGITTGTGTVTAGMVFTIAGVYDVHPLTKVALPSLKQFVVVTGGTASGVSDLDLVIYPTIYDATTGKTLQNVSALPANDAVITFFGAASTAYQQNLAYHKSAYRLASVPLHLPKNEEFAAMETVDGISVAVIRGFDILKRREILRVDALLGFAAPRPEWGSRISG